MTRDGDGDQNDDDDVDTGKVGDRKICRSSRSSYSNLEVIK